MSHVVEVEGRILSKCCFLIKAVRLGSKLQVLPVDASGGWAVGSGGDDISDGRQEAVIISSGFRSGSAGPSFCLHLPLIADSDTTVWFMRQLR